MTRRPQRNYGSKRISKTANRAALRNVLLWRKGELDDAAKQSLARSYGVTIGEVERVAAEVNRA